MANAASRPCQVETGFLGSHKVAVTALLVYRETLISADRDGLIGLWDLRPDAPVALRCTLKSTSQINAIAVQSLSDILSSARSRFVCPSSSMLASCLPDALLFAGENDSSLSVWSLSSTKLQSEPDVLAEGHLVRRVDSYGATCALVSAGRILISASIGRFLCFWDTRRSSFETTLTLATGSQVCSLVVLQQRVYGGARLPLPFLRARFAPRLFSARAHPLHSPLYTPRRDVGMEDGTVRGWELLPDRLGARLACKVEGQPGSSRREVCRAHSKHVSLQVEGHPGVPLRHINVMDGKYVLTASDKGMLQAWRSDLSLLWCSLQRRAPALLWPSNRSPAP